MNAFKSNIYKYLGGTCQYLIPVYQRTYSWDKTHCGRLWSDIVNLHRSRREGHFLGSIVRIDEDAPAGSTLAMIIDGQQRLTTLTLLLVALRDYAEKNLSCGVNPDKITNTLLINHYETGEARYKLLLTQSDREALIKIVTKVRVPDSKESRVMDNYSYFAGLIAKGQIAPDDLYEAIGKLQIVDIVLDRQYDDPQAIFESLNSTGMDLKDSDLIRNHLLMGLDPATQMEIYDTVWRPTEQLFDYQHQSELLDNFFRDYLTMKLGRIPKKNEVYKEFCAYRSESQMPIEDLCHDIYHFAKHYSDMLFVRSIDPELKALYRDIKTIRMEVAYPFLLRVHDDHDKGLIDLEDLRGIVRLSLSYVLRRAVCDMPTNSLNRIFAALKHAICTDDYLRSVKAAFVLLDAHKEFPNDERFLGAFVTRDIYNLNRCRYILGRLENWDNKAVVSSDNLTIEHIIPQNPNLSEEWKKALGENWKEVQKTYLHTIGNLTLSAYNPEMSDLSFHQKLNMSGGFKESALRLNKYVVTQSTWGGPQVQERAGLLAEVAKKIWPYPVLSVEELDRYNRPDSPPGTYALDSYNQLNPSNRAMFEDLNTRILNFSTAVKREFKKYYVAYKLDSNFACIVVLNWGLRIFVGLDPGEVVDPKGITKDVRDIGHWGTGDIEITMTSLEQVEDVVAVVEQAFLKQDAQ